MGGGGEGVAVDDHGVLGGSRVGGGGVGVVVCSGILLRGGGRRGEGEVGE
jgi:hypothetical protein